MEKRTLNKSNILNLIKEEANFILKQEELHNKVTQMNEEIKIFTKIEILLELSGLKVITRIKVYLDSLTLQTFHI